jgi:hypothetical protein
MKSDIEARNGSVIIASVTADGCWPGVLVCSLGYNRKNTILMENKEAACLV